MKFRGHESFYLRQGWLTKGMRNVVNCPNIFYIDKKEQTDILGIGSNMVKALRYWLEVMNLIEVYSNGNNRIHVLTDFGRVIWKRDKYIQDIGTKWLLHYHLVINLDRATSWYWLFNEYTVSEFNESDFLDNIKPFISAIGGVKIAERSLKDDFKCLIRTYLGETQELESNMFSPLAELDILRCFNSGYKFTKINKTIEDEIVMYVILDQYLKSEYQNDSKEINIERINSDKYNVARTFKMSWNSINQYLDNLQKKKLIRVNRTSGLDVINILTKQALIEMLNNYYITNEGN